MARSEAVTWALQFFTADHLPEGLREVSAACGDLAEAMTDFLPDNPQTHEGLRLLLQAKDAFVRAALAGPYNPPAHIDYELLALSLAAYALPREDT